MLRKLIKFNCLNKYKFNVYCGKAPLQTRAQLNVPEKAEDFESKYNTKINSIVKKYDEENTQKILKIINNYNLNELLGYEISKARAKHLISWRMRYGLLKSLNDVFSIEGFGVNVTDKLFQSLLLEPKTKDLKLPKDKKKTAPFVIPALEAEQRETIKSTVSIRVGVNSITWSRLDIPAQNCNAPCLLTHWQHHEISEKKLHINELIHRCLYINHIIPEADCYLFENPQVAQVNNNKGSVEQQNINIQKAQVIAVMGYALAARQNRLYEETDEKIDIQNTYNMPNVFYLRRFLASRLFNHLVATERVSTEETVLNMMRTFYNIEEMQDFLTPQSEQVDDDAQRISDSNLNFSGQVQFPVELREMFSTAPRYYREFLGQSLLINLAFVRLVLLQDAKSIEAVSKVGNKTT